MEILQIIGIALIGTFITLILKQHQPTFSIFISIFVGIVIFMFVAERISVVVQAINGIAQASKVNMTYFTIILKVIGISYIAEIATQITKEAGQSSIASKIEIAGKVIIIGMAIPIITAIIQFVVEIMPGY